MRFNPDLSTIQESTYSNGDSTFNESSPSSPVKLADTNENLKRSILSGLNNIRRFQQNQIFGEESTIIEEDSSIFDENDHRESIQADYENIPLLVSSKEPDQVSKQPESRMNPVEEMRIAGSGTYDLDDALSALKENSIPKPEIKTKRPFLKRGQGKNCLRMNQKNENQPKPSARANVTRKSKDQKLQSVKPNTKLQSENKTTKTKKPREQKASKTVTKPSQTKISNSRQINQKKSKTKLQRKIDTNTVYNYMEQEPEDSFDVSIQNEKQINAHLDEKNEIEEIEFNFIEQMLSDNSKLTVTQCDNILNYSGKSSSSAGSIIENYHAAIRMADPSPRDEDSADFNPNKYEEVDSLIETSQPSQMKRVVSYSNSNSIPNHDIHNLDSMPSSISASPDLYYPQSHMPQGASKELEFDDNKPWDYEDGVGDITVETITDCADENSPSFSTPCKKPSSRVEASEPAGPSKLMSSIFKNQFNQRKAKENQKCDEVEKEKMELELLKQEVQKQKEEMKRECDRFKRENLALNDLRKQRERELEILKMEKTKTEKENQQRSKDLDIWEKEINSKLKEFRRLDQLQREAEKSGMIRRKEFDELKSTSAIREKELKEKCDRVLAANQRLKVNCERMETEINELKQDNRLLKEKMDEVVRSSKRREGNTWREINRIVDEVTEPTHDGKSQTRPKTAPNSSRSNSVTRDIHKSCSSHTQSSLSTSLAPSTSSHAFESGHTSENGLIEKVQGENCVSFRYASGKLVLKYDNGTVKERSPDGNTEITRFANGDVQHSLPDKSVVYYFGNNGTKETKYPDGRQILEFPNQQKEIRHLDGRNEIFYPDGFREVKYPCGKQETFFQNGVRKVTQTNGDEIVFFKDGQKETRTKEYRRREMPDGTTKTIFSDTNFTETRYASGRVRIKDGSGNLIVDRKPENT